MAVEQRDAAPARARVAETSAIMWQEEDSESRKEKENRLECSGGSFLMWSRVV